MKLNFLWFLALILSITACKKLDQEPQSTTSKPAVFGSENGLQLYTNSFYNMLPGTSTSLDAMSDYLAVRSVPNFIQEGVFAPNLSSGWTWGDLRNINYFITNNVDPKLSPEVRRNYTALALFFRAYFYFEKVKRFGDVPWINKPLSVDDPSLYGGRDSRALVMDSVLADLDYAVLNLRINNENSRYL
jgi:hypothetical protein